MKKSLLFVLTSMATLSITGCGTQKEDTYTVDESTWNELIVNGGAIDPFNNVTLSLEKGGVPFLGKDVNIDYKINNGNVFINWPGELQAYFIFDKANDDSKTNIYRPINTIVYDVEESTYDKGETGGNVSSLMNGFFLPGMDIGKLKYDLFTYDEENKLYSSNETFTANQLPPLPINGATLSFTNTKISFLNGKVTSISYTSKSWSLDLSLKFTNYGTTSFTVPVVE